jgi:hypothetical protein
MHTIFFIPGFLEKMKTIRIHHLRFIASSRPMQFKQANRCVLIIVLILLLLSGCEKAETERSILYSAIKPKVIKTDLPDQDDGRGGFIVADITGDGRMDFIITKTRQVAAYENSGKKLWRKQIAVQVTKKSEKFGLPGWHAPGIQATDLDEDEKQEVLFLSRNNELFILDGVSGAIKSKLNLKPPKNAERWEHLVISNFRGKCDCDVLLQATNSEGYRMGRYIAAFSLNFEKGKQYLQLLWQRDDFLANAHSGARVADLDGDGKDEVLGGIIISPKGKRLTEIPVTGHIDSIFVADIRKDIQGLEVVALEEGGRRRFFKHNNTIFRFLNRVINRLFPAAGNYVFLYNRDRLIWKSDFNHLEPQNASIGEFDTSHIGLEIWCRSRFDEHQKPFVFNAKGHVIANYEMDNVAPPGWTVKGVEVISPIQWRGDSRQLLAAKERHKAGDVAIFDAISGEFLHRFRENADRLYVADVFGDWREELIVLNGNELHIYENTAPNLYADRPRLWTNNYYKRSKMTWNYYNP